MRPKLHLNSYMILEVDSSCTPTTCVSADVCCLNMLILVWLRWRHCTQGNTPDASWIPLSALWLSNKPVLIASGQQRICAQQSSQGTVDPF